MIPICNDIWTSLISNTEIFPDADKCVLCRCDVPHSRSEHDEVLDDGGKLRCKGGARPAMNASNPEYWERRRALDRQRYEEIQQRKMLKVKQ